MGYSTDFINGYSMNDKLENLYEYDIDDFTYEVDKYYRDAMMVTDTIRTPKRKYSKQASVNKYEELIEQIKAKRIADSKNATLWAPYIKTKMMEDEMQRLDTDMAKHVADLPRREPHPATLAIRGYLSTRPKDRIVKVEKAKANQEPTLLQTSISKVSSFLKKSMLFNPRTAMRKILNYMTDMPVFWPIWSILSLAIIAAISIGTAMKASVGPGNLTFDSFIQAMPSFPAFVISTILPAPYYLLGTVFISIIIMDIVTAAWEKIRG